MTEGKEGALQVTIPSKRAVTQGGGEEEAKKRSRMVDTAAAAAAKAKGNGCLTSGDFQGAVDAYTEAIGHDPTDKVFYSNRSAAYASMKNFEKALEDGNKCVELEPSFSKGYGRAGAALHGMGQYEEAVTMYNKGLEVEPGSAQLKQGLEAAKSAAASAGANPIAQLFNDPTNLQKLASNPTTLGFLQQPDFVNKCDTFRPVPCHANPQQSAGSRDRACVTESRKSRRTRPNSTST